MSAIKKLFVIIIGIGIIITVFMACQNINDFNIYKNEAQQRSIQKAIGTYNEKYYLFHTFYDMRNKEYQVSVINESRNQVITYRVQRLPYSDGQYAVFEFTIRRGTY